MFALSPLLPRFGTKRNPATKHRRRLLFDVLEDRSVPAGFNFADFATAEGLNLVGDASITPDARLRLNPAASNQAGAAWYGAEKQYLAEGFSTTFQFQMTEPNESEGLTFAIQHTSPFSIGTHGNNLAYNGLQNSVVVEFDTWQNEDQGDPSPSHVSVHTGGAGPNGVNERFSLGSFSTSPVMDDGAIHTVRILYAPGTLSVFLDNLTTPVLTVAIDLTTTLTLDNGLAWLGFTASTGGGTQVHDILNWEVVTPPVPTTTVSINSQQQTEGNTGTTELAFTVVRSGDTSGTTIVNWMTIDGSATAGTDYISGSGELVFGPGEIVKPVVVVVNGDSAVESHETLSVQLTTASGGTIVAARGIGTILNDETTMSVSDGSVTEGEAGYAFLDTFVKASDGAVNHSRGVTFGPDGHLYVGHLGGVFIPRYSGLTGEYLDVFADGTLQGRGTAEVVFHDGYLFVAANPNVLRFDAMTGAPAPAPGKTGSLFVTSTDQGVSSGTHAFAFGPDGNLYLSNQFGDNILRYDGVIGSFIDVFVGAGSGGLDTPVGLTFGPDGNLYVGTSHTGPDSILRFQGPLKAAPGSFVDEFVAAGTGGLDRVASGGIRFRPDGDLYVTSGDTDAVLRFNGTTGALVETVVASGEGGLQTAGGHTFDANGLLYVSSQSTHEVLRYAPATSAAFVVTLSQPSALPVTVNYATGDGTALAGSDYVATSGTLTFAPGQTRAFVLVPTLDNALFETNETFVLNLSNPSAGAVITDSQGVATISDNDLPPTKFYVVDDQTANRTFEYGGDGTAIENYTLNSGNSAPRGAASSAAGDKVWVVDANKKVYVYDAAGALLGSWTAGSLAGNATPDGIATNGTDVWIVDSKSDKVFRYTGAAARLSGSQNAVSSFSLNTANKNPKGIVTDGTSLWVVNDASPDKVFKYTLAGGLLGSWTIDAGNTSPTGITLDPTSVGHLWIVDSGTDRVYQYDNAVGRTSGSQAASSSFALAAGNTNPQGIADPPSGAGDPLQTKRPRRKERPAAPRTVGIGAKAIDWQSAVDAVFGGTTTKRRR
jgi:hypothetical protein